MVPTAEVLVVADHHADRRIDDLGGDAIAHLIGEARFRVPAAAMQLVEAYAHEADVLGGLPGRSHDAHRDRRLHAIDHEHVADAVDVV